MELSRDEALALARTERILNDRLSWLLLSVVDLSEGGYLRLSWEHRGGVIRYKAAVRWHGHDYEASSWAHQGGEDARVLLTQALDSAAKWLREAAAMSSMRL